ncbi:crotonase/enoyl-CoA hydratase family protein [Mumia zhuanghuii]|uniref:Crotonase/enoyl-CoA hydratase family protein n=2 Tax=Mumia TaxID=1546255 RepID=A0ABW1QMN9_9ACTN|nr:MULTISPECIES: crotonase/enoyl-CoA hydratase family protein [Mumia]KAA1419785.1 crotonase/enoyl-CoA hydratase family protein [Mumia zhuanghuii]
MSEPRVLLDISDAVATVTLNRPDKLNGVDLPMLHELVATARAVRADRDVRAVVLRGSGDAFCAGLDFASVLKSPTKIVRGFAPSPLRGQNLFQHAFWTWRELPVPVIAVVHGYCYGAGLQLATAADFRFTTPDARWSVLEAKWGLVPDMSGTVSLRELVGGDVARRLTMTGEVIDGTAAHAYGLASGVADDPALPAAELVAALKERSPDSVAASKVLLNRTRHASPRRAFAVERRLQLAMLLSKNAAIARAANARHEAPQFLARAFGR